MADTFTGGGLTLAPVSLLDAARRAAEQLPSGVAPGRGRTSMEFDADRVRGEVAISLGRGFSFGAAGEFGWARTAQRRVSAVLKGSW